METFRKGNINAKIKVIMENLATVFLIPSWKVVPTTLLKFDCFEKKFFINALRFWSFISLMPLPATTLSGDFLACSTPLLKAKKNGILPFLGQDVLRTETLHFCKVWRTLVIALLRRTPQDHLHIDLLPVLSP